MKPLDDIALACKTAGPSDPAWSELLEESTGLITSLIRNYCPARAREKAWEDVQAACRAAVVASVTPWDPDKASFGTFVHYRLRHAIQKESRAQLLIKIPVVARDGLNAERMAALNDFAEIAPEDPLASGDLRPDDEADETDAGEILAREIAKLSPAQRRACAYVMADKEGRQAIGSRQRMLDAFKNARRRLLASKAVMELR